MSKEFELTPKERVESEQEHLFCQFWNELLKEEKELDRDFGLARNLAASRWEFKLGTLEPVEIYPDQLEQLKKNFHLFQEEISRKKYYLIKAFRPLLKNFNFNEECYLHWEEELAKEQPNFSNRFEP